MIYRRIADRIISNAATNFSLDMEYRDIYAYSLERYLSNIFNLIVFSIVAIAFRIPGETIVFAVFYGPLRKYAGGIHVKSRGLCLVLSVVIMISIIWLSKGLILLSFWRGITSFLLIIACLLIFILAPVDTPRRRLTALKKQLYRKRSRWIIGVEAIILLPCIFTFDVGSRFIVVAVLAVLLEGIFLIPNQLDS